MNKTQKRQRYHSWLYKQEESKSWISRGLQSMRLIGATYPPGFTIDNAPNELNKDELDFTLSESNNRKQINQITLLFAAIVIYVIYWIIGSELTSTNKVLASFGSIGALFGIRILLKQEKIQTIKLNNDYLQIDELKIKWGKILAIHILQPNGSEGPEEFDIEILDLLKNKKELRIKDASFDYQGFLLGCSIKLELDNEKLTTHNKAYKS